jgi:hypothetical protein
MAGAKAVQMAVWKADLTAVSKAWYWDTHLADWLAVLKAVKMAD